MKGLQACRPAEPRIQRVPSARGSRQRGDAWVLCCDWLANPRLDFLSTRPLAGGGLRFVGHAVQPQNSGRGTEPLYALPTQYQVAEAEGRQSFSRPTCL